MRTKTPVSEDARRAPRRARPVADTKEVAQRIIPEITRRQCDHDRCEDMLVEFMGGPLDGMRLNLDVVQESPTQIRVLEARYHQTVRPVPLASEVEAIT